MGRTCKVSFGKADGSFYSVEVEAATLYEAVVIALSSLTPQECREGIDSDTRMKVRRLRGLLAS
jgi:hypothetical protein